MKKGKKKHHDPRLETPPGYYFENTEWLPESEPSASFFSVKDTLFFAFLVSACFVVAAILWLKPPKIISYDSEIKNAADPSVAVKNLPEQLRKHPGYDHRRFEEVPDDDPIITGDENDLPMKEAEPEQVPRTLKSDLKRVIKLFLASLHLPRKTLI